MNKQIILENKRLILAVILVILGLILAFIEPYLFSAGTGIPYWFLVPRFPFERRLNVKLNTTSFTLGSAINVTVRDALDISLLIAGADVRLSSDGVTFFENITTDSGGNATFIYTKEPTILFISKANYSDVDPIFIPKTPDWWVTVRNYQYITFAATLLVCWVSAFHLYMQWNVEHLKILLDKAKKYIKIYSGKSKGKSGLFKNRLLIFAIVLFSLGLVLLLVEPYVFSAETGVPHWFLSTKISFFTPEKRLEVEVSPTNFTLGSAINVTVRDALNRSLLIAGADVRLSSDGVTFFENITTDSGGNATFIYTKEPTILFISKANYSDVDPIFIPKTPDWWVTVRNYQYITFAATLLVCWVSAFHLYMQWSEERWWMLLPERTELELIGELSKIHSDKYKMSRFDWKIQEKLGINPDAVLNVKKEAKRQAIMKILREVYGWK
ncbi:MAG: hypothetical protein QW270_08040 [Candidatus Bathyarchaeia archaeon]